MEEAMMLDRSYILNRFLNDIHVISDRVLHERSWIKGLGPDYRDFEEFMCQFFEVGDPMLEEYKEFGLTQEQYQILKNFRDKFDSLIDHYFHPFYFIDTPEWAEIMKMAQEVLKAFHYDHSSVL